MNFTGFTDKQLVALAHATGAAMESNWARTFGAFKGIAEAVEAYHRSEIVGLYRLVDDELERRGIHNEFSWTRAKIEKKLRPSVLGLWFEKGDGWAKFYLEEGSGSADLEITTEKLRTIKDRIHSMLDKTGKVAWNIVHTSSVGIRVLPFTEGKGVEVVVGFQRYTADEALHIINTVLNHNGDND